MIGALVSPWSRFDDPADVAAAGNVVLKSELC